MWKRSTLVVSHPRKRPPQLSYPNIIFWNVLWFGRAFFLGGTNSKRYLHTYIYISNYIYIYIPSDRSHMILVHWKENLLNSISEGQGNGPQIPANGDADWRYSLPAAPQPKSTHGWHISKASVSPGLPGGFPPERTYGTHLQEGIGFHGQK